MKINRAILTNNLCYIEGRKHIPAGVMVHSTAVPGVMAKSFISSWNTAKPGGSEVCVHAFLDNTGVYQTLPFDMVGWHSGGGALGSANYRGYIGFEICEPRDLADKQYFNAVKKLAVQFVAHLCKTYGILPEKPAVISHKEGHQLGIASNHEDIDHWWPKYHNYTMDKFRAEVKALILGSDSEEDDMKEVIYNTLDEVPAYAKPTILKLISKGYLNGDGKGNYALTLDMIRVFVIHDRIGLYDK